MRNYILLLLGCGLISVNAQTTRENISRLKDNTGKIYYSITRIDSTLHCSFKTEDDKNISYCISSHPLWHVTRKSVRESAYHKLSDNIYPIIDSCFNALPSKNEEFFIEDSDSIFITLEHHIYQLHQWEDNGKCIDFLNLRFRGGRKNAEVSIGVNKIINNELSEAYQFPYWSKWMTKKELKLLFKKLVWQ